MRVEVDPLTGMPRLVEDIPIVVSGGSGGITGIRSVVGGTNVTVDNTDPQNPIVNASGGGLTIGNTIGSGTNNQLLYVDSSGKLADSLMATGTISVAGLITADTIYNSSSSNVKMIAADATLFGLGHFMGFGFTAGAQQAVIILDPATGTSYFNISHKTDNTATFTLSTQNANGNIDMSTTGVRFGSGGQRVQQFSSDGSFAANLDTLVPSQKATKTYVDNGDSSTLSSAESYADSTKYANTTTLDQIAIAVASVDINSNYIIDVLDPINPQDVATKNYVDSLSSGVSIGDAIGSSTTEAVLYIDGSGNLANDGDFSRRSDNVQIGGNQFFDSSATDPNLMSIQGRIEQSYLSSYTGGSTQIIANMGGYVNDSAVSGFVGMNGGLLTNGGATSAGGMTGLVGAINIQASSGTIGTAIGVGTSIAVSGGADIGSLIAFQVETPFVDGGYTGTITTIKGLSISDYGTNIAIQTGTGLVKFGDNLVTKGHRVAYVAKTTTYGVGANDEVIDCTSGTFTVTLPTAVGITGQTYTVKNSGTGVITIATTSAQTIDSGSTAVISYRYDSITVVSDNANWKII